MLAREIGMDSDQIVEKISSDSDQIVEKEVSGFF